MNMTYVGFDETVQYLREVLDKDEKGFDVSSKAEEGGRRWAEKHNKRS